MLMDSAPGKAVAPRQAPSPEEGGRRPLHAPRAMCEAYDYSNPVAFSRGMEVRVGGARMVFVSGTASVGADGSSLHRGDLRAQTRRAFENAAAVLASGGASWHQVVKVTVFLRDIDRDYTGFNEVRKEYFRELDLPCYPASTCVEARLCRADLLVEMEMLAIVADESGR
jgi:enamine deaminase RidA (YjgF/YER057c/UK114 family)